MKSTRGREVLVLAASAAVVLAGAAAVKQAPPEPPEVAAATSAALPPPLPSGAPPRAMQALPAEDERAAGCHFTDRGFGDYGAWRNLSTREGAPPARVLVPAGRAVRPDGSFRLLIHLHGAEPVRKQLAQEGFDLVIAALDAGVGSHAYERAFTPGPATFDRLVEAVEREVAAANGLPAAHAEAIVISSWSAGYGAIGPILTRPDPRLEAIVLLDSLYAGYIAGKRTVEHGQIPLFLEAARQARSSATAFYLTHTAIGTPGYASTGEVASYLLAELGVKATPVDADPREAHALTRMYEEGRLVIRGYAGADRDAHCAQLHLLPSILRETILPGLGR
ncbi:MAG: hypothetical protein ACMG6S_12475 [Byssovorax sp.]